MPETNVLYGDVGGSDQNMCTKVAPCASFLRLLTLADDSHQHISFHAAQALQTQQDVGFGNTSASQIFFHFHGASFSSVISGNGTANRIFYSNIPVAFIDAVFTGNTSVLSTTGGASLTLKHVTVHDSQHIAVSGPFTAWDLTIYNNTDTTAAIVGTGSGDVVIDRALIHDAQSVLSIPTTTHVHLNNLMVWGIANRPFNLANNPGELEFSTIANAGYNVTSAPCSLACGAQLQVTASIIWQPQCGGLTYRDATDACTFTSSIVSNDTSPPGTANFYPMFVNPTGNDFHIKSTSPAVDKVDSGPPIDFEGDKRPGGVKFDIGADEIP